MDEEESGSCSALALHTFIIVCFGHKPSDQFDSAQHTSISPTFRVETYSSRSELM